MRDARRTARTGMTRGFSLALALAAVAWSAACGGDDGTTTAPPPEPPPNRAPTASGSIAAQTVPAGESVSVNVASAFSDPDGNQLSFTAASSDAGVASASVSGSNVTINGVAAGTATVTVTATDPGGLAATQGISVTVEAANQAPMALAPQIDPATLAVGETLGPLDLSQVFVDPDGDALTFEVMSSDTAVATVSLTGSMATVTAVGVGTATLTATATDPDGESVSISGEVTVVAGNQAPVALAPQIPPDTVAVGGTLGPLDLSQVFVDPDGDALTFEVMSSDTAVATVSLTGSMATVTAVGVGTATLTVTATDPDGESVSISGDVTVVAGNQAPVTTMGPIPPLGGVVGTMIPPIDLSMFFEDPDGDELTFAAESSDAAVVTATVEGSTLTVALVGVGTATLTVTATDPGNLSVALEASVTVVEAGGNQAPMTTMAPFPAQIGAVDETLPLEGDTLDLAHYFEDPDGDALTFSVVSDNEAVATATVAGSLLSLAMVEVGMATVTVTATDPGGLSASLEAMVTVAEGSRPVLAEGTDLQALIGAVASLLRVGFSFPPPAIDMNAYFNDPDEGELTFTAESSDTDVAEVSIVEGSNLAGKLKAEGTVTGTITATDPTGLSVSLSITITVLP